MKINYTFVLLIPLLFNGLTATAQSWLWAEQGTAGLKADVYPSNVITNKTGNVYQAGGFETSLTFGATTLVSPAIEDIYLVKYDQNGNVLWARQSLGGDNNYALAYSVATDDSDNSYITGFAINSGPFGNSTDTITFGSHTLYLPIHGQLFLVKYDPNGNVLWAIQPDTSNIADGTEGWAVTTDKSGHEYVTGDGAFLCKYDRNGNVMGISPQLINDTLGYAAGYSLATDGSGNVYMAGQFEDTVTFGSYQLYSVNGGIFIAKFNSSGNVLWAKQSNNNSDFGYFFASTSVAVDESGAAYLTSAFIDTIMFGPYIFTSSDTTSSFYVMKYNPDGTIAWGKEATSINATSCESFSICTDDSNHVYISGEEGAYTAQNSSFVFANDTLNVNDSNINDAPSFLIKLDPSGNALCGSTLDGGAAEFNTVTSDSTGKFVYLGGVFISSFIIGNDSLINNTSEGPDSYVGRWQPCHACDLAVTTTPQSTSVCDGQSVVLTASGGINYSWSPAVGLNTTTGDTVIATPLSNATYTVSITDLAGCSGQTSDTITLIYGINKPVISQNGNVLTSSATEGNQWFRNDSLLQGATNQTYTATMTGWYVVMADNPANGCNTTSDSIYVYASNEQNEQVLIYPNPTKGEILINISSSVSDLSGWKLQVIDELGRTLFTMPLSYSNIIDLSFLPAAMYFITITNNSGRTVTPIVKVN